MEPMELGHRSLRKELQQTGPASHTGSDRWKKAMGDQPLPFEWTTTVKVRTINGMKLTETGSKHSFPSPIMWFHLSGPYYQSLRGNQLAKETGGLVSTSPRIKKKYRRVDFELSYQSSKTNTAHPFDYSRLILAFLQTAEFH